MKQPTDIAHNQADCIALWELMTAREWKQEGSNVEQQALKNKPEVKYTSIESNCWQVCIHTNEAGDSFMSLGERTNPPRIGEYWSPVMCEPFKYVDFMRQRGYDLTSK